MEADSDDDDNASFYDEGTDLTIRGATHTKVFCYLRANDILFSGGKDKRILRLRVIPDVKEKFRQWRLEYIEAALVMEEHLEAAFGSTQNSTVSQDEARPAGRIDAYAFLAALVFHRTNSEPSKGSTGFLDYLYKHPLDEEEKKAAGLQSYFMDERTARNQGHLLFDERAAARQLVDKQAAHNISIFGRFRISNPSQKLFQVVTDMFGVTSVVPNGELELLKQQQHLFAIPFTLLGLRCRNGPHKSRGSRISLMACTEYFFNVHWWERLAPELRPLFLSWQEHIDKGDFMILCVDGSKKHSNHSVWAVPDRIVQLAGGRLQVVSFLQEQSFAPKLRLDFIGHCSTDVAAAKKFPRDAILALPDFGGVEADIAMSFSHATGSSKAQPKVLTRAFAILAAIHYKARPAALLRLAALGDNDVANLIGAQNGDTIVDYHQWPQHRGHKSTWNYAWIWLAAPEVDT